MGEEFSIPDRLDPVAPTQNTRRQGLPSDQHRRRDQNPPAPQTEDADSDSGKDGEDSHKVDEFI
jgi:hypothetical protein